ncbi:hypothetical protein VB264_05610 [Arcicella aquatica]|uniref:Glutathionylspermidine synthase n=1 Tax=Arcicella aquatica TaxID=217141 RepID=A0ABU5QJZ4_9BACT|nr:hypothetical protein [Arcicella aquatica]MEA5257255.1 hypothetical protein [Arcicella aquatica]
MQKEIRASFNQSFSEVKYQEFLADLNNATQGSLEFRVAETPVFVPKSLKDKLISTCESIIDVIAGDDFKAKTDKAIPTEQNVPNENEHTSFLAIDFAVCQDDQGEFVPQLIELQGFPSLFGFQYLLSETFQKHYNIPDDYDFLFNDFDRKSYIDAFKKLVVSDEQLENVIILEIYPEKQKTRVDFEVTEKLIGVKAVCLTKIIKEGRKLFYINDGVKTPIHRIYNRLIFDDLTNFPDLRTAFSLTDDVDVEWIGHPNWFFRISKYTMPFLNNPYIPECRFLSDYTGKFPENLSDYVLKPLFSFAGTGVKINVSESDLTTITDPENYILQKKVKYEPVIQTTDGSAVKCEIRMLYIWQKDEARPILLSNLARLSRGEMIGVRFNKDFDWVGGSVCFMER